MDTATPEELDTLEPNNATRMGVFKINYPIQLGSAYGIRVHIEENLAEASERMAKLRVEHPEAHVVDVSVTLNGETKDMTYAEFFTMLGFNEK